MNCVDVCMQFFAIRTFLTCIQSCADHQTPASGRTYRHVSIRSARFDKVPPTIFLEVEFWFMAIQDNFDRNLFGVWEKDEFRKLRKGERLEFRKIEKAAASCKNYSKS